MIPLRSRARLIGLSLATVSGIADAAAIGRMTGPSITGAVRPGDAEQVQREWVDEGFERPLRLSIGSDSGNRLEMARLGAWLRTRRPVMQLTRDCVNACARSLLPSGRAWLADRGVLIAFSSLDDWPLVLKQTVDDGQLFLEDQGSGSEVKARFIKRYSPIWDDALAVQALRSNLPERAQSFLNQLTRLSVATSVTFTNSRFNVKLNLSPLGCLAWVPDVAGLQQLGIDLPSYHPPERAEAAKRLKLPAERLYIGAMPDTPPTQPLCEGGPVDLGDWAR